MDFPTFFSDLPITRRALEFAAARHTGQRRAADQAPFILHPLEFGQLLRDASTRTKLSPPACCTT